VEEVDIVLRATFGEIFAAPSGPEIPCRLPSQQGENRE